MGLFSSKKKTENIEGNIKETKEILEPLNEDTVETVEEIIEESAEEVHEESVILNIVKEKCEGGAYRGGHLFYSEQDFTLNAKLLSVKEINNAISVQIAFSGEHKFFDEPMVDSVVGIGKTKESAVENASMTFATGVLPFILSSLECKGENFIETELFGKKHSFRKPSSYGVAKMGCENTNSKELFKLIEDDIADYLGTKKAYWIKMYVACSNNKVACEVRINNVRVLGLTKKLDEYAKDWSDTEKYHSEKEYVLLVQSDDTYEECPYSRDIAMRFTKRTIEAMSEITDKETHEQIYEKVRKLTDWHSLNVELSAFVPEIYCECVMKIPQVDYVVAMMPDGTQVKIKKTQLRCYSYIANAIIKYLNQKKPSQAESFKIVRLSSTGEAINKAVKEGKNQNEVIVTTGYKVDSDYVVW